MKAQQLHSINSILKTLYHSFNHHKKIMTQLLMKGLQNFNKETYNRN